jgi:hypothetical protein
MSRKLADLYAAFAMNDAAHPGDDQPAWCCRDCGSRYSRTAYKVGGVSVSTSVSRVSTYHEDPCDVCGKEAACTEPRDFGGLKPAWKNHRKESRDE